MVAILFVLCFANLPGCPLEIAVTSLSLGFPAVKTRISGSVAYMWVML